MLKIFFLHWEVLKWIIHKTWILDLSNSLQLLLCSNYIGLQPILLNGFLLTSPGMWCFYYDCHLLHNYTWREEVVCLMIPLMKLIEGREYSSSQGMVSVFSDFTYNYRDWKRSDTLHRVIHILFGCVYVCLEYREH